MSLEGIKVSAADHARADRFIAGEIDLAEFLKVDGARAVLLVER